MTHKLGTDEAQFRDMSRYLVKHMHWALGCSLSKLNLASSSRSPTMVTEPGTSTSRPRIDSSLPASALVTSLCASFLKYLPSSHQT
jgi:hypothetical protein